MAIYHLEAKVVTRGAGRTACGAAAYMSCSRVYNHYDGIQHDYTRKGGLVWEHIFLPRMAPEEWQDRETLWNAVEANEKTKDSQLAREFIVALPIELNQRQWIGLVTDYVRENFVSDGMCADVAIHDTDGHNPHAHILLTMRPLDEKGDWQYKTEKEYLCVREGEERGFTAAEFKAAQGEGWEKQYPYKVGKKKVYMTPSAAEAQELERASKYPKSTKYGRQNPITARWNSEEQLVTWRASWAEMCNSRLERAGREERIDHRSHAERGLDEQPTVHEGASARKMEQEGFVSERCEINRQIRKDNALIHSLKAAIVKLKKAVETTIPTIAAAMETIRQNIIVFNYGQLFVRDKRKDLKEYTEQATQKYKDYQDIRRRIKAKSKERSKLDKELTGLSVFAVKRRKELKTRIELLTEEIRETEFEEKAILEIFNKEDASGMKDVHGEISKSNTRILELDVQEEKFTSAINREKEKFDRLKGQAVNLDQNEISNNRLALRPQMEQTARSRIQSGLGNGKVSFLTYQDSVRDTDSILTDEGKARQCQVSTQHKERENTDRLSKRNSSFHDNER